MIEGAPIGMSFTFHDTYYRSHDSTYGKVSNWFYDEDDDTILEFGEEIADDFAALEFRPQALV